MSVAELVQSLQAMANHTVARSKIPRTLKETHSKVVVAGDDGANSTGHKVVHPTVHGITESEFISGSAGIKRRATDAGWPYKVYEREGSAHVVLIDVEDEQPEIKAPPEDLFLWFARMMSNDPTWDHAAP